MIYEPSQEDIIEAAECTKSWRTDGLRDLLYYKDTKDRPHHQYPSFHAFCHLNYIFLQTVPK